MNSSGSRLGRSAPLVLALVCGASGSARAAPVESPSADAMTACRAAAASEPLSRADAMCFYEAARRDQAWDEAQRELEALVERSSGPAWARLGLASVVADRGDMRRAVGLVAELVDPFPPDADVADQATLLANYGQWSRSLGQYAQAERAFERLIELGEAAGMPEMQAAGEVELGFTILRGGGDLIIARALYDAGIPRAAEQGSYTVVMHGLRARAELWQRLGKPGRARADYQQMLEASREHDDAYVEAFAAASLIELELSSIELRDGPLPASLRERLDAAHALAARAQQVNTAASLWCLEGSLASARGHHEDAVAAYGRCAEIDDPQYRIEAEAWRALHLLLQGEDAQGRALSDAVDVEARRSGNRQPRILSGFVRTVAAWRSGDRALATTRAQRLFDDVELLRDLQTDEHDRSQAMRRSAYGYYFFAGSLLAAPERTRADLALAFGTMERLRARSLLDGLRRADANPKPTLDPDEQRWRSTLQEITVLQRSLLSPALEAEPRAQALDRLVKLERRERVRRGFLHRGRRSIGELLLPRFPGLDEVRAALAPDEALISYQLADERNLSGAPEGGAWVWTMTRDDVRVVPIPERRAIEGSLGFIEGLLVRRDGSERPALSQLHRELVAPALAELDPAVKRLVIVPDGGLWALPFSALSDGPSAPPLASRYSISVVPSVTSWMDWRARPEAPAAGLLAMAPRIQPSPGNASWRAGTLEDGVELGTLPRARQEVETITELWNAEPRRAEVGDSASERFLKASELSQYGMLHFATHAVMDAEEPERSAVVLTPGGDGEDGLLQAREIVRLPLDGQVVVLSACSGASGAFVRGEGVMSLARAFLQSGAQAVVASRWALADADAMALFSRLYSHLDEGHSLSASLALAQRDMIAEGAPTAAWAGVVVVGRGDLVLVPRPWWWPWRRWLLVGAALLCLGIAAAGWRVLRRHRDSKKP
ncbi:MAG: CHAT domain-containing protein [Myxococcota bacterium]